MEDYSSRLLGMTGALHRIHDKIWNPSTASNALEAVEAQLHPWKRLEDQITQTSAIDSIIKREMAATSRIDAFDPASRRIAHGLLDQRPWQPGAMYGSVSFIEQELLRRRRWEELLQPSAIDRAYEAAERASRSVLPDVLEAHRSTTETMAFRLAILQPTPWWQERIHLDAFAKTSAIADALRDSALGVDIEAAMRSFIASPVPELPGLSQHRAFLDAAGLWLPRWPRVRLLSRAEKRDRFKRRLGEYVQPKHVKKARSLVDIYELALRLVIDWVMTQAYGEEWWAERLPLCDCGSLLGKWQKSGESVPILDLADYTQYARIMTHPEHFAAGFAIAFSDREVLERLIKRAGALRARIAHVSEGSARFTQEHLRELRATWVALEEGLILLEPGHDFDY